MPFVVRGRQLLILLAMATSVARQAGAQPPLPGERLTFRQAIDQAIARNPQSAAAAAGILRAAALIDQTRSASRLQVSGSSTMTTLSRGVQFEGVTVTPRTSVTAGLDVRYPLYAPATWARRVEARDTADIADLSAAETRRQIALATADAYLTIIARRRVVEANTRARDAAKAHFDLAAELENRGTGSRLNRLRAQQELTTDEGLIEAAAFGLYRAQEALGVLVAAGGPVDAADEPQFDPSESTPASPGPTPGSVMLRSDLRLFAAQEIAAQHVFENNRTNYQPVLQGIFQPQTMYPSQFFTPQNVWRALLQFDVRLFDSGQRAAEGVAKRAAVDEARAARQARLTEVASEERTAREAVASAERQLGSVRAAASQAQDVVNIVNISFRAGAATNIEVIDAERGARDADTSVAVAEDALRRAKLDLLNARGQFP